MRLTPAMKDLLRLMRGPGASMPEEYVPPRRQKTVLSLVRSGLVERYRDGDWFYYRLTPAGIAARERLKEGR